MIPFLGLLSITRMLALTRTRAQGMPDGIPAPRVWRALSCLCLICRFATPLQSAVYGLRVIDASTGVGIPLVE